MSTITLDWIAPFQQHMNETNRLITALVENWVPRPSEGDEERKFIARQQHSLVSHASTLAAWASALPLDEDFWAYLRPYDLFHGIRTYHSVLLRDLDWFRDAADIEAIRRHLLATLRIMDDLRTAAYGVLHNANYGGLPHQCPPSVIVNNLCLGAYAREIEQLPTSFHMQDWPAVVYHPFIHTVLHDLAARLWRIHRAAPVHVSLQQTPDFFEIALLVASLHFRPEMWDGMMDQRQTDHLETVRSIGCEIEPLTWNEGQGEGVIVRLPWTKGKDQT
jgi:hypothetical protein